MLILAFILLVLAAAIVVVVGPAVSRNARARELGDGLFDAARFVHDARVHRPVRLPREVPR